MNFVCEVELIKLLEIVKNLNEISKQNNSTSTFKVEDCWFDEGAQQMWTTILITEENPYIGICTYQFLTPAEQKLIAKIDFSKSNLVASSLFENYKNKSDRSNYRNDLSNLI
jgi:hypothetical protein